MAKNQKSPAASRRQGAVLGVELDGTTATAVALVDGVVEAYQVTSGNSAMDALAKALSNFRTGDPVRVVLTSPSVKSHRVDVTSQLSTRAAFTKEAWRLMGNEPGYTLCGVITDTEAWAADRLASGLAVALPVDQVATVYETLEILDRVSEVVPVPSAMTRMEGLCLAVRNRSVDLTLTVHGQPLGYEVLDVLGMEALILTLGGEEARRRIMEALSGQRIDPIASSEVARWVSAIVDGCVQAVSSWRAAGTPIPDRFSVLGPGAQSVGLLPSLRRAGFTAAALADTKPVASVPPGQRLELLGAYLAAASYGSFMPASAFVSPSAVSAARREDNAKRRRTLTSTLVICALAVILPALAIYSGATVLSGYYNWRSSSMLESSVDSAAGVAALDSLAAGLAADQLSDSVASVGPLVSQVLQELPKGVTVLSVEVSPNDGTEQTPVVVKVLAPSGGARPLQAWVDATSAAHPDLVVQPVRFAQGADGLEMWAELTVKEGLL